MQPVWTADGKELLFLSAGRLMSSAISTSPTFKAGPPQVLFDARYDEEDPGSPGHASYDVTPDGARFVFVDAGDQRPRESAMHVVVNWFEELQRRVPTSPQTKK